MDDHSTTLAIDTSTAACSAALFAADGSCLGRRDEIIGRGHSERLVPMIAELLEGRRPNAVLAGVGPGSFTGIRVSIATAQGLAIGWGSAIAGMSSLALLAALADGRPAAAAMAGGHGELFIQQFGSGLEPETPALNLPPDEAAARISSELVIGPAAGVLVAARGWGEAVDGWPSAARAMLLPAALRSLPAKPLYARAPDATAKVAA